MNIVLAGRHKSIIIDSYDFLYIRVKIAYMFSDKLGYCFDNFIHSEKDDEKESYYLKSISETHKHKWLFKFLYSSLSEGRLSYKNCIKLLFLIDTITEKTDEKITVFKKVLEDCVLYKTSLLWLSLVNK